MKTIKEKIADIIACDDAIEMSSTHCDIDLECQRIAQDILDEIAFSSLKENIEKLSYELEKLQKEYKNLTGKRYKYFR